MRLRTIVLRELARNPQVLTTSATRVTLYRDGPSSVRVHWVDAGGGSHLTFTTRDYITIHDTAQEGR